MSSFATKYTYINFVTSGTNVQVENGNTIKVWGVIYTIDDQWTDEELEIRDGAGVLFQTRRFIGRTSVVEDIPYLADKGLSFTATGSNVENIHVTVFHSQAGG